MTSWISICSLLTCKCTYFASVPPVISEGPDKVFVRRGETAHLYCNATGQPTPRIRWIKDGRNPVASAGRVVVLESGEVIIRRAEVGDGDSESL